MTVICLETGKLCSVNSCYGARLIEQGKAIPAPPVPASAHKEAKQKEKDEADGPV